MFFQSTDVSDGAILYFGWDKRFRTGSKNGRIHGIYNAHAHKSEVEFIPYGELGRSFWALEVEENRLSLQLLNSDSLVERSFKRIYEFPQ